MEEEGCFIYANYFGGWDTRKHFQNKVCISEDKKAISFSIQKFIKETISPVASRTTNVQVKGISNLRTYPSHHPGLSHASGPLENYEDGMKISIIVDGIDMGEFELIDEIIVKNG